MALIDDAKAYLQITWEDQTLTKKLELAIPRGEQIINNAAGAEQDFETPGVAQGLLFDYLRYVRSDAAEMFLVNYARDLLQLRELTMADLVISEAASAEAAADADTDEEDA